MLFDEDMKKIYQAILMRIKLLRIIEEEIDWYDAILDLNFDIHEWKAGDD